MHKAALFGLLILLFVSPTFAQIVKDENLRGFDELGPIFIDVDGDGKLDRIQPRTYQTFRPGSGRRPPKRFIRNWITFDLHSSRGLKLRSFFTYNYGTAEQGGSYWVYAIISAGDLNHDKKTDLLFYSGDDTTDETVKIANLGKRFAVLSRKKSDSDDWVKEALDQR